MQARKDAAAWYVPITIFASTTLLLITLSNSGCIINVSSLMATKGGLGASAYAASKAGVIGKNGSCRDKFFLLY